MNLFIVECRREYDLDEVRLGVAVASAIKEAEEVCRRAYSQDGYALFKVRLVVEGQFPGPALHSLLTAIAGKGEASPKEVLLMRAGTLAVVCILLTGSAAFATEPMTPSDVQATFFNGEPFTASTPGGTKFKMTFTPDGKMTREPLAQSGQKNTGKWKLSAKGFCTTWQHAKPSCFTVIPRGENEWSVQKTATTIAITAAVWSK